ncbi:MAG: tetratricopeptide repeat protein [Planctomycetota bacterium]
MLCGVYALMAAHVVHWQVAGTTLAPLELNEVMHTLELGIVTAGFLFMLLALVSVLIFGRFFCSWGCHILALEDFCAWLLGKLKIRPRPIRSRALAFVPPLAMFYMFVWPQLARIIVRAYPAAESWLGARPVFELRVLGDSSHWASFVTTDFWRNLPGPWVALLTFFMCGFAIVYLLGTRAFCRYGCPYGAIFALADRVAPGRIVLAGDCTQCARCTAVCDSGIQVHKEIARYGRVVNSRCLKDLDCVSVCPTQGLAFGFARPMLLDPRTWLGRPVGGTEFTWAEELLMAALFVGAMFVFRGLYFSIPFLATLGIGAGIAFLGVLALRLSRRPVVSFHGVLLKRGGQLTACGRSAVVALSIVLVVTVHSAVIRWHEHFGVLALESLESAHRAAQQPDRVVALRAFQHLSFCEQWGLVTSALTRQLAFAALAANEPTRAGVYLARVVESVPGDGWARLELGRLLARQGQLASAEENLRVVLALQVTGRGLAAHRQRQASAHELLGMLRALSADPDGAMAEYGLALELDATSASVRLALAELLANRGAIAAAIEHLDAVVAHHPEHAAAWYNRGVLLGATGREADAIASYRNAVRNDPRDAQSHNNLGYLLSKMGQYDDAIACFRVALQLDANYAEPHFNLGRCLAGNGLTVEAAHHFARAAELDPRYREFLAPP